MSLSAPSFTQDIGEPGCDDSDPEHIDQLRASVGLSPFGESLAQHRKEFEAEGGKAPVKMQQIGGRNRWDGNKCTTRRSSRRLAWRYA